MTTPRLGAPELVSGQATPETTVNEQIRYIESGAGHFIFISRVVAAPPGSPADGDCYLVAASPTGAWAGQAAKIAFRVNTAWAFITAIEGFTAWVNDENAFIGYDGAVWNVLASPSGTYVPLTYLDTDGTLAANSDTKLATQKAVRTYVTSKLVGMFDLRGTTDCSANPNYPAATKGDAYVVSVAGKIGGASGTSVSAGDVYFATADNAGGTQTSVGASWDTVVHAGSLTGALLAANNLSDVASASTARTNLGLAIGTNVQAWDADLDALAALSGTNTIYYRSAANTWTGVTIGANLTFSGGTLAASSGGSGDLGAFYCYEEKPSGVSGGDSASVVYLTRMLNTDKFNSISGASRATSTVTMTIASPGVVTWTAHGLGAGEAVQFTTTGALPTGLTAYVTYYVSASPAPTTNTFSVSATQGGTAINTSGTQSGTHTAHTGLITLPAGTYDVDASMPCYNGNTSNGFKGRLYNLTAGAELISGTHLWGASSAMQTLEVRGRFTLSVQSVVRLETYAQALIASGLGANAGFASVNNHYSDIRIRRVV